MFPSRIAKVEYFLHEISFDQFKLGEFCAKYQNKPKNRHICAQLYYCCSDYART